MQKSNQKIYCHGYGDSVVFQADGSTPYHKNFVIVKESHVAGVGNVQEPTPGEDGEKEILPVVDTERTKLREERMIRTALAEAAKIGDGVSDEAQMIFNALSKTLPCRWNGKKIVILEEVRMIF